MLFVEGANSSALGWCSIFASRALQTLHEWWLSADLRYISLTGPSHSWGRCPIHYSRCPKIDAAPYMGMWRLLCQSDATASGPWHTPRLLSVLLSSSFVYVKHDRWDTSVERGIVTSDSSDVSFVAAVGSHFQPPLIWLSFQGVTRTIELSIALPRRSYSRYLPPPPSTVADLCLCIS